MNKVIMIDLSHTIEDGLITYKGLPAPIICDYLSREDSESHYEEGTRFNIGKIEMVANTGTYIDSPFHRYQDGRDLSQLKLEEVAAIDALLITPEIKGRAIEKHNFENFQLEGKAVIINTGWARHWKTDAYFEGHPYLTEDAAVFLQQSGVKLVGIDSLNIDNTDGGARPVHSHLLRNEVLIVEHLCNLEKIAGRSFEFYAVPVKVSKFGTFPVRAFGKIKQ